MILTKQSLNHIVAMNVDVSVMLPSQQQHNQQETILMGVNKNNNIIVNTATTTTINNTTNNTTTRSCGVGDGATSTDNRGRKESLYFSACLLWQDDYGRLVEWIAYHYYALPLRKLIIHIHPNSRIDPTPVLERWDDLMDIEAWRTNFTTGDKQFHLPLNFTSEIMNDPTYQSFVNYSFINVNFIKVVLLNYKTKISHNNLNHPINNGQ